MNSEQNPLSQESKLARQIQLGKRVCVLAAELTNKGQELREKSTQKSTTRDRALIAL